MNTSAHSTPRNGARWLTQALEAEGVETLFGYPGGTIMPFYDALVDSRLKHILVRHEQGAALAANGYARASGRVGVCVATSGPGASNLVTGIADAMLDSVPMICLTGQVATPLLGTDAFQELDVFGMTMPIVKHSFLVRRVEELPEMVREAFRIAREGRPGPVLIDLPRTCRWPTPRICPCMFRQRCSRRRRRRTQSWPKHWRRSPVPSARWCTAGAESRWPARWRRSAVSSKPPASRPR